MRATTRTRCKTKIAVGDTVVDTDSFVSSGRIMELGAGGLARIQGDDYAWSQYVWNLKILRDDAARSS